MQGKILRLPVNEAISAMQDIIALAITSENVSPVPLVPAGLLAEQEITIYLKGKPIMNRPILGNFPRIIIFPDPYLIPAETYMRIVQNVETATTIDTEKFKFRFAIHCQTLDSWHGYKQEGRPFIIVWRHDFPTGQQFSPSEKAVLPAGGTIMISQMWSAQIEWVKEIPPPEPVPGFWKYRRSDGSELVTLTDSGGDQYANTALPLSHFFPDYLVDGAAAGGVRNIPHPAVAPLELGNLMYTGVNLGAPVGDTIREVHVYLMAMGTIVDEYMDRG